MSEITLSTIQEKLIDLLAESCGVANELLLEQWESSIQKQTSFREQLNKSGLIKDKSFQIAVSQILDIEFVEQLPSLTNEWLEIFTQAVPIRFAKKYLFYPYEISSDKLIFAVLEPWPDRAYTEAASALGFASYSMVLTAEEVILDRINQSFDRGTGSAEEAAEILEDDEDFAYLDHLSSDETEDLLDVEDEEPIKKLMNSIIVQSVRDNSSDIHIDPSTKETTVRYRIDGVLHQITTVPKQVHIPLVNRVKVMSGLDISTKSQPQDGRTMIVHAGKKVDIRVSIIPTVHGEQAVLRLLNQSQGIIPLEQLGMNPELANKVETLAHQPHGIILVSGPTGSGKTTTLYSALNSLNAKEKNIVTIEDPVEYRINDYGQMQVNEKTGVTFAIGLRAMLRQDPDIIMIGEMRDTETAQIAIQASLTGHLVLSTIHTNEAAATVIRLIDMGIEPYLVTSTVSAILAQRLVRKICENCKESYEVSWNELVALDFQQIIEKDAYSGHLWKGKGCDTCMGTGYRGRVGIYELLIMNEDLRKMVNQSTDLTEIKQIARDAGMQSLKMDCGKKVINGQTTIDEMMRVVYMDA